MKYLAALFVALTLGTPAFADECATKIKQLEDIHKASGQALSGGKVEEFRSLLAQAKQAQKDGNTQLCNSSADRAQQIYNTARNK